MLSGLSGSSVLTDIDDIINTETVTIIQKLAQLDKPMTPSDVPPSQDEVEVMEPEKKRRKINDRSTSSPVSEEEWKKNKYCCDTCWRSYS